MGKTLHHKSMGSKGSVADLARRVYRMLSNKEKEDNLLSDVFHNEAWAEVTSADIVTAVRTTAKILTIQERVIDPDMIGAHSFRAGGAMAIKTMVYKDSTINLGDGRQIPGKCISTAKLKNYWRASRKR